jgi:hypothetical protein
MYGLRSKLVSFSKPEDASLLRIMSISGKLRVPNVLKYRPRELVLEGDT